MTYEPKDVPFPQHLVHQQKDETAHCYEESECEIHWIFVHISICLYKA